MKNKLQRLRSLCVGASLALLALLTGPVPASHADSLYIGDQTDNTVKHFDADSGEFLGEFVKKGHSPIKGPRGLIFTPAGDLLVSNQNVGTSKAGTLLLFDGASGDFSGALVRHNDEDAPFAPDGIVLVDGLLFVADQASEGKNTPPGRLLAYTTEGLLQNDLTPDPVSEFPGEGSTDEFHPRGVVLGPDGLLYVSVVDDLDPKSVDFDPLPGWILRFDPVEKRFVDVFASYADAGCAAALHRPDGLVFGPGGRLYVTAFRADAEDTDKILIFDGSGTCVDQIDLDQVGQPRAVAQAVLFGPINPAGENLFVPISGGGPDTGAIRRYNPSTKTFSTWVAPAAQGGALGEGWYLTFGQTAPDTLSYPAIE